MTSRYNVVYLADGTDYDIGQYDACADCGELVRTMENYLNVQAGGPDFSFSCTPRTPGCPVCGSMESKRTLMRPKVLDNGTLLLMAGSHCMQGWAPGVWSHFP